MALVTGAADGIGRAIAITLAERGADVVVNDLAKDACADTVSAVERVGRTCVALAADVSRSDQASALVQATVQIFDRVDTLVNNAGVRSSRLPVLELPEDGWDQVMAVNLKGPFYLSKAVGRLMKNRGQGCIVNIASLAGHTPAKERADYCVSKAGLIMLSRVLALELGPYGVRVNAVAPEVVRTSLSAATWSDPQWIRQRMDTHSLGASLRAPRGSGSRGLFGVGCGELRQWGCRPSDRRLVMASHRDRVCLVERAIRDGGAFICSRGMQALGSRRRQ